MLSEDRIIDLPAPSRRVAPFGRSASNLVFKRESWSRVRLWGWYGHSVVDGSGSREIPLDRAAQLEIDHGQAHGGRFQDVFPLLNFLVRHGHPGQDDGAKAGNPDHVAQSPAGIGACDLADQGAFQRLPLLLTDCNGREKLMEP